MGTPRETMGCAQSDTNDKAEAKGGNGSVVSGNESVSAVVSKKSNDKLAKPDPDRPDRGEGGPSSSNAPVDCKDKPGVSAVVGTKTEAVEETHNKEAVAKLEAEAAIAKAEAARQRLPSLQLKQRQPQPS